MRSRKLAFKLALVQLSAGGVLLHVGFQGCVTNAAYTNLATSVGNGVINTAADAAGGIDPAFDAVVVNPVAGFLSDLWTVYVGLHIPADPVFQNGLLVQ
jgi:hypothetical protein